MSELISNFKNWLISKKYSDSTVRNYLVDINKYLLTCPNPSFVFSQNQLNQYITAIHHQKNFARSLASINKFCQFGLDQRVISTNPIKQIIKTLQPSNSISLSQLIDNYRSYLSKHHKSDNTITNYINDLKQFLSYLQTHPTP